MQYLAGYHNDGMVDFNVDVISSVHIWNDHPLLIGQVCWVRQLSGPSLMTDYFILINGLIMTHWIQGRNSTFKYSLPKAFDSNFGQVVGIGFWTWIYSMLLIFSVHIKLKPKSVRAIHPWAPFLPGHAWPPLVWAIFGPRATLLFPYPLFFFLLKIIHQVPVFK